MSARAWTDREQLTIGAAYLVILGRETHHTPTNKAAVRRAILPLLEDRSAGSYEMKMCNISAALNNAGRPWIIGYKPLGNAQRSLLQVLDRLAPMFDRTHPDAIKVNPEEMDIVRAAVLALSEAVA